jgi:hypothetical protein
LIRIACEPDELYVPLDLQLPDKILQPALLIA